MIADLAAALALILGGPQADPQGAALDARLAASAEAAERLQGDLDGRWTLADTRGRPVFVFQIADPPGGSAPLEAGWREADGGAMGPVEAIARAGRSLTIAFDAKDRPARLALRRARPGLWRGWLTGPGSRIRVLLRR